MKIHVEDLAFQCILGILDFERETEQDVIVNLELTYAYNDKFINYADIVMLIKSNMQNNKFLLIEDALENLSLNLKNKFSEINTLDLKITKPSILSDCTVSVSNNYSFNS